MNGQWIGSYSGTNSGMLVADFDDLGGVFAGAIHAYDNIAAFPRTYAYVEIPKAKSKVVFRAPLQHVERGTGLFLTPGQIVEKFPGVQVPSHADTEWDISPDKLSLTWTTDAGTNGQGELLKGEASKPSQLQPIPDVETWDQFKALVLGLDPYQFAFRGHRENTWRLRTSFHRTGRSDLLRFMNQDIAALHRHLSGLTTHRFNLADPLDYAAFLNLAQHHGYPTPVLDWTQSPFVAAYFAFRDLHQGNVKPDQKVRIFILDSKSWSMLVERASVLMPAFQHMTVLEPLATNNARALPQQSISTVTNIDDLEAYIHIVEKRMGCIFLRAIDLPASERRNVMQELVDQI